jgi:hypothetical protein
MTVPAAEAVITKGRRYVGRAVADIVAKVGSFNTKGLLALAVTAGQGLVRAWGDCRGVFGCDLPLPRWRAAGALLDVVPGTLRRPWRVVNPLGYTRRP